MPSSKTSVTRRVFALQSLGAASVLSGLGGAAVKAAAGISSGDRQRPTSMAVMLRPNGLSDASLNYVRQVGVEDVQLYTFDIPGYAPKMRLELADAVAAKERLQRHGLRFAALTLDQKVLANFLLGKPEGKDDLENFCHTVETLGRIGVPLVLYSLLVSRAIVGGMNLPLPGYYVDRTGRGGAALKAYDDTRATGAGAPVGLVTREQEWDRMERFLRRCVPVAESAGVRLACHPADPPVERYWGIHQALTSMDALQRFVSLVPSPSNALLLCQGTIQEAGIDVLGYIRTFAPQGKLAHVELRGVRGRIPQYSETFMDDGDLDLWTVVKELKKARYAGSLEVAHVPGITGDSHRNIVTAWSAAYLKGLLAAAKDPAI